jgi:hypothetical protein
VDCDTYNIPIFSSDGSRLVFNLWMLDSAWYDKAEDKCYQAIKPETVEWYKKTSQQLKDSNGGKPVPSLMFAHIPLPAITNLIEQCGENDIGALKTDNGWYRLRPDIARGTMKEYPSILEDDGGSDEIIHTEPCSPDDIRDTDFDDIVTFAFDREDAYLEKQGRSSLRP